MAVLFANRAITSLARPLFSNETAMLVCGTERFPLQGVIDDGDWFRVTLTAIVCEHDINGNPVELTKQESVRVTSIDVVDPRIWFIERNQDQSEIPLDFPDGACVELRLDALVLEDLQAEFQGEAGGGGCHCPVAQNTPPTFTPSFGDEWWDSSVFPWIIKRWDGVNWVSTGVTFDPTIPEFSIPVTIPAATINVFGVVRLATSVQITACGAGGNEDNVVTIGALCQALSNGFLAGMVPAATTDHAGVVEFATAEEFNACCQGKVTDILTLCQNIQNILPLGSCEVQGIVRFATLDEAQNCLSEACDPNDLAISMGVLCDLRQTNFFDSIPCPTACQEATTALENEVCVLRSALFNMSIAVAAASDLDELATAITDSLAAITECS